jgi:hypothetical protein
MVNVLNKGKGLFLVYLTDQDAINSKEIAKFKNFLLEQKKLADCIVTNPPYRHATEFIRHAIELGVKKHAWLLRLSFLEGMARHERLYKLFPPARVWVFSKRLTIWRGDEEKNGSGTTAYAWFVWERGKYNETTIGWI